MGNPRFRGAPFACCVAILAVVGAVGLGGCNARTAAPAAQSTAALADPATMTARQLYELGRAYENGDGVPQDMERAVELMQEASMRGESRASERLGLLAARGVIQLEDELTYDRLVVASLRGSSSANLELARLQLEGGLGRPRDIDSAISTLEGLVALNDTSAMLELAGVLMDPDLGRLDYRRAEQLLMEANARGQFKGALQLARLYALPGTGLTNVQKARDWASAAVQRGLPEAWLVIGDLQADPQSGAYDPVAAEQAYQAAIDAGVDGALADQGRLFETQMRYQEALALYEQLLAQGEDSGIAYRAAVLLDDNGVGDRSQAYPLFLAALRAGRSSAVPRLIGLVEDDVGSGAQQAEAIDRILAETETQADPELLARVGELLLLPRGNGPDLARGIELLQSAVSGGNMNAAGRLARLLRDGAPGLPPNAAAAARYYGIEASAGDTDALVNQGRVLEEAGAVEEAAASYLRAINAGQAEAAMRLFRLLEDSPGLDVDIYAVSAGLERLANAGDAQAMLALGDLAAEPPSGDAPDYAVALDWYQRAAAVGNALAFRRLGDFAADRLAGLSPELALGYYQQALANGDDGAGLRTARTLLQNEPDRAGIAQALELTARDAASGDLQSQYWHGVAQRLSGNYNSALEWLIKAYLAGEERALEQIVMAANEGAGQADVDIEALLREMTTSGSACDRAFWHTLLGDLASRGVGSAGAADQHYQEGMALGDPNAAAGLGRLYVTGIGLPEPDLARAYAYLTVASELGADDAAGSTESLELVISEEERALAADLQAQIRAQMGPVCR